MATPPKVSKNPAPLPPGMDNPWYDYVPFPKRPRLTWPKNARVGFYVILHLEYYELMPPEGSLKDSRFVGEFGNYSPDYRTWTQREYGNRTGIFRVLDVLDRYQIKAGVAVNAMAAERYPFLVEQCKKRGYEFIAHGTAATRVLSSKMTEAEEKAEIATSIAAIEKAAGVRPTLFRAPHGFRAPWVTAIARSLGERTVGWSLGVWDSDRPGVEAIAERTVSGARPGSILLLHDGDGYDPQGDRMQTARAVPLIIDRLHDQGFRFELLDAA